MFKNIFNQHKRVNIEGENIFIDDSKENVGRAIDLEEVIRLSEPIPEIRVYEDNQLVRQYRIDTLIENPNLLGQFLHCSIRILNNSAVMIDGIISKSEKKHPSWTDSDYEGIRLQPFYISNANDKNIQLIGKGLFDRGLHFNGTVTPASVRCICICDSCKQSFSLQNFHAGFAEVQYFYSTNSRETLVVPYNAIAKMPTQRQEVTDVSNLTEIERKLPKSSDGDFRYYNSFRCPHCLAPFIDFQKYREIRASEYYGNTLLNTRPRHLN